MSPKHRLLLADDSDTTTLTAYLSSLDCDTKVVASTDVLECVADWQPDLVVLDPVNCGLDLCRQIKQDVRTRKTMMLAVTQLNKLDDIDWAVQAGADDFLSQPIIEAEFLKRTENLLRLSRI